MMRRLWLVRGLLVAGILLSFPGSPSGSSARTTPDEIFDSMRELVRIPLSGIKPGSTMRINARIEPGKVTEYGPGARFFQVSLVQQGATKWMLPWPKEGVSVAVSQDGKDLPLWEVHAPFYLISEDATGPTGLAFDPVRGKDCTLTLTFNASDYPKNAELVVAPNWPDSMMIKDQIVGAMVGPSLDSIFVWINRAGLVALFAALLLSFRLSSTKTA